MERNAPHLNGSADSEKETLRIQHQDLAGRQLALDKDNNRLRRLRNVLNQERLKFNGERELSRRQLQAERADILHQQRRLMGYSKELKKRAQAVAAKEQQFIELKRRESAAIQRLDKEAEELEQRNQNLRSTLAIQEKNFAKSHAVLPEVSGLTSLKGYRSDCAQACQGDLEEYLSLIDKLASCLADERLRLIYQVEHLVETKNYWEKEHAAGVQELEAQFERLEEAERDFENRAIALRKQQAETQQARQSLESRHARLTVQATNWKAERERLLAQIQSLETKAQLRPPNSESFQIQPRLQTEAEYAQLRQQLANLEGQRATYEKQVAALNAEVERLAGLLMEDFDPMPLPVAKAA
jgi:DNA repair exonuclease SbcCD ATPase subunit